MDDITFTLSPNDRARVTCCCGQSTFVQHYGGINKSLAADDSWVFDKERGWNCGKPGHQQEKAEPLESIGNLWEPISEKWSMQ